MMVRRVSLIVPMVSALVAVSTASAQPRPEVGPWGTMELVGETLQERQDRRAEAIDRIEEQYPLFYARNAERLQRDEPLILTPLRLAGLNDGPVSIGFFGPVATAAPPSTPPAPRPRPAATPSSAGSAPSAVVPYEPLVLGSLFGVEGEFGSDSGRTVRPFKILPVAPQAPRPTPPAPAPRPTPPPPAPTPAPAAAPAPAPAQEPAQEPRPTPPAPTRPPVADTGKPADAFLNFGDGPYPAARTLTVGEPQAWYKSPVVTDLLGRTPTPSEKQEFKEEVRSKVEESFRRSGLDVDLTTEPGRAAHTLSVVSGALAVDNPEAIGIADIGGDGFTFIDNFVSTAIETMDDLETAIANNISHELMHAFGVDYHDESGTTIDSGRIPWDLLTRDDLAFSDEAVGLLSSRDFQRRWDDGLFLAASHQVVEHGRNCSCHPNGPLATPEPTTLALWALTLLGAACSGRRRWRARG